MDKRKFGWFYLLHRLGLAWAGVPLAHALSHKYEVPGLPSWAQAWGRFGLCFFLSFAVTTMVSHGLFPVAVLVMVREYFKLKRALKVNYLALAVIHAGILVWGFPGLRYGLEILWPYLLLEVAVMISFCTLRKRGVQLQIPRGNRARTRSLPVRIAAFPFQVLSRVIRGFVRSTQKVVWWIIGPNPMYAAAFVTTGVILVVALVDILDPQATFCVKQQGVEEFLTVSQLPALSPLRAKIQRIAGDRWEGFAQRLPHKAGTKIGATPRDFFYSHARGKDGSRSVYMIFGHGDATGVKFPIIRANRETGARENLVWAYNPFQGGCSKTTGECVVATPCGSSLIVLNDRDGSVKEAIANEVAGPMYVSEGFDGNISVAAQGCTAKSPGAFDPDEFPVLKVSGGENQVLLPMPENYRWINLVLGSPVQGQSQGFVERDGVGNLFYGGDYPSAVLPTGENRRLQVGLWNSFLGHKKADGGATDPDLNVTYVTSPFVGVLVYDANLRLVKTIGRQMGLRAVTFDRTRRLLYVGDYFRGYVEALDVDRDIVVHKWWVGDSIRSLHYYDDTDEILATSASLGFFIIHPGDSSLPEEYSGQTYADRGDPHRRG